MSRKISKCDKCGSNKLEDRAESGNWWVYCHNCYHEHEDDTEVDKPDWRGFDDEVFGYTPD